MATSDKPDETSLKNRLFHALTVVVETSLKKSEKHKASNRDRQSWARVIIQASRAYSDLYSLCKVEELEERVQKLEDQQPQRG